MAGIYIHIPFCKTRCLYCDFYSTVGEERKNRYLEAVGTELRMRAQELSGERIETVYFGGGTPSRLTPGEFGTLFDILDRMYGLDGCREITLEANPDDLSFSYVSALRSLPFNRISLGVQSFDDRELRFLNRRHTAEQASRAIETVRNTGLENISIDLMYGLPRQTPDVWEHSLQCAVASGVPHISAYHLIYEEGTSLTRLLKEGKVKPVDEDTSIGMFGRLIDSLTEQGFLHYEISNFARPGYLARHNTSYWKDIPYLGVGAAAHSYTQGIRQWNVADLDQYITGILSGNREAEQEIPTPDSRYNDRILTSLRTMWGLSIYEIEKEFGAERLAYLQKQAAPYLQSGKLVGEEGYIKVSRKGLFISDRIISDLMFVE